MDIVNDNDEVVGQRKRREAEAEKLRYRVVHVLLENKSGGVVVQWRKSTTKLYPRTFTASAAGGVSAGQTYAGAASRELKEELGVDGVALQDIGNFKLDTEYLTAMVHVFAGQWEGKPQGWENEADAVDVWSMEEAAYMSKRFSYLLTPSFTQSLQLYMAWKGNKNG